MAVSGTITNTPIQAAHYVEWKIPEFTSLPDTEDDTKLISSPTFSFIGESWQLKMKPNGCEKTDSVGYISAYLQKNSSGPVISLDFSIGFKAVEGEEKHTFHRQRDFSKPLIIYGCHRIILRSDLLERHSQLLPFNILTIFCSLKLSKPTDANQLCATPSITEIHENKILLDLKEWFLKKEDCDVIIKVKEQEFPAHRSILQARSIVFASTFRNEMKEKTTGIVEIEDCDPSSFSDFLCFVYCGSGNISAENVFNLYITADKYDVQDLRAKCLAYMKENLSVDTFCDTITLAMRHSEKQLIKSATDYFIKNAPKIVVTAKWLTFLEENPTRSNELIIKLLVPETSK